LDGISVKDPSNVIGFFAKQIRDSLRLVGGHDILFEKVKEYIRDYLFGQTVELADLNKPERIR